MLPITIAATELWDERSERFVSTKEQTLHLEHSLVSISKWESKWHKPFLHTQELTYEETIDYIRCMTLTQNVSPETYLCITPKQIDEIKAYMNESMTATTFGGDDKTRGNREIVTAEIIYYWMTALQIPFECKKWHISRLLTLIRVCSIKNSPKNPVSRRETASQYAAMNAARKKRLNTKG